MCVREAEPQRLCHGRQEINKSFCSFLNFIVLFKSWTKKNKQTNKQRRSLRPKGTDMRRMQWCIWSGHVQGTFFLNFTVRLVCLIKVNILSTPPPDYRFIYSSVIISCPTGLTQFIFIFIFIFGSIIIIGSWWRVYGMEVSLLLFDGNLLLCRKDQILHAVPQRTRHVNPSTHTLSLSHIFFISFDCLIMVLKILIY